MPTLAEQQAAAPQMVKVELIASIIGLSVEQVYRITKEGIIKSEKVPGYQGRMYPFVETIKTYISHLQTKIGGRGRTIDRLNLSKLATEDLKRRKLQAQVLLVEGGAHKTEDVEAVMNDMLGSFRTRLLALPTELAPHLAKAPDEITVTGILTDAIESVCSLLAEYNAEDFYNRNADYVRIMGGEDDESSESEVADENE